MTQTNGKYLTPKEIAAILKVSVRTVQRCITTNGEDPSRLKAIRVGQRGMYRIAESEFYRWLDYDRDSQHKQGRLGL
jgi:excisionase family DNA binding protein